MFTVAKFRFLESISPSPLQLLPSYKEDLQEEKKQSLEENTEVLFVLQRREKVGDTLPASSTEAAGPQDAVSGLSLLCLLS